MPKRPRLCLPSSLPTILQSFLSGKQSNRNWQMKMKIISMRRMDLRNGGALVRIWGGGEGGHGSVVDAVDVVGECLLLFLLPFHLLLFLRFLTFLFLHPSKFELPSTSADSTQTSELADESSSVSPILLGPVGIGLVITSAVLFLR